MVSLAGHSRATEANKDRNKLFQCRLEDNYTGKLKNLIL